MQCTGMVALDRSVPEGCSHEAICHVKDTDEHLCGLHLAVAIVEGPNLVVGPLEMVDLRKTTP